MEESLYTKYNFRLFKHKALKYFIEWCVIFLFHLNNKTFHEMCSPKSLLGIRKKERLFEVSLVI